jgi:FtsP/CotA-like multicopper oxidase with cupredoxin domain
MKSRNQACETDYLVIRSSTVDAGHLHMMSHSVFVRVAVLLAGAAAYGLTPPPELEPEPLHVPPQITSDGSGSLDVHLTFGVAPIRIASKRLLQYTRSYNGELVGPTIRANPGDVLLIHLTNELEPEHVDTSAADASGRRATFHSPNRTGLHTHGLHVSPRAPGDNIFMTVAPGESRTFVIRVPDNHAGGTFWYHPHSAGGGSLGAGAGAAGMLIISDDEGALPPEVAHAEEISLLVQDLPMTTIAGYAREYEDACTALATGQPLPDGGGMMGMMGRRLHGSTHGREVTRQPLQANESDGTPPRAANARSLHSCPRAYVTEEQERQERQERQRRLHSCDPNPVVQCREPLWASGAAEGEQEDLVLVNGQLAPALSLTARRWYRVRMVFSSIGGIDLLPSLSEDRTRYFDRFDEDHSGSIDSEELRVAMESLGEEADAAEAEKVLLRYAAPRGERSIDRAGFTLFVDDLRAFQEVEETEAAGQGATHESDGADGEASRELLAAVDGCEVHLLAKDGVYLPTAPRYMHPSRPMGFLGAASRADWMVRCAETGAAALTYRTTLRSRRSAPKVLLHLSIVDPPTEGGLGAGEEEPEGWVDASGRRPPLPPIAPFRVVRPCYLVDLADVKGVSSHSVEFMGLASLGIDGAWQNGFSGEGTPPLLTLPVGEVFELVLWGTERLQHVWHMHVAPVQLADETPHVLRRATGDYFQRGDWHDVIRGPEDGGWGAYIDGEGNRYVPADAGESLLGRHDVSAARRRLHGGEGGGDCVEYILDESIAIFRPARRRTAAAAAAAAAAASSSDGSNRKPTGESGSVRRRLHLCEPPEATHHTDAVRVRFQTARYTGLWPLHCHYLWHQDMGMIGLVDVVGVEGQRSAHAKRLDPTCLDGRRPPQTSGYQRVADASVDGQLSMRTVRAQRRAMQRAARIRAEAALHAKMPASRRASTAAHGLTNYGRGLIVVLLALVGVAAWSRHWHSCGALLRLHTSTSSSSKARQRAAGPGAASSLNLL